MKIGYACLLVGEPRGALTSVTVAKATALRFHEVVEHNLNALEEMIAYNLENNIQMFRMSSDLIPLATHPLVQAQIDSDSSQAEALFNWKETQASRLARLGQKISEAGMRVSMHPGQYTVLNSPKSDVVDRAKADLEYHNDFMDLMGLDATHKIILHVGGVYGHKSMAIERFILNYGTLSEGVRRRLVIENDDKSYNIEEVFDLAQRIGAPAVFDNLHHLLNPPSRSSHLSEFDWISKCQTTWGISDGPQKIHYSQQRAGALPGSHSQTIDLSIFKTFIDQLPHTDIDIMLEVKDKNLSALKCLDLINPRLTTTMLEKVWAKYKYLVLSRSAGCYNELRQMLKDKEHQEVVAFYASIDGALSLEENSGAEVNAAQHVWGYVNKGCTAQEKAKFEKLLKAYEEGRGKIGPVKKLLYQLAMQQESTYLLNSYYFYKPFLG